LLNFRNKLILTSSLGSNSLSDLNIHHAPVMPREALLLL